MWEADLSSLILVGSGEINLLEAISVYRNYKINSKAIAAFRSNISWDGRNFT